MTPLLNIEVCGVAAPQGSKNPGRSRTTGKMFVYEQNTERQKGWRDSVITAAAETRKFYSHETFDGPVEVAIFLRMPRPASVSVKRRPFPSVKPDIDKLARNILDGLTQAAVYRDDAQVVRLYVEKQYATDDPGKGPGASIRVGLVKSPEII